MNDGQDDGINSYDDYIKALVKGGDFEYATDREIGISVLLDMVPVFGEFKLGYEILVGEDLVSHVSLSAEERGILIATLGIGKLVKYGVGKIVGKGAKGVSNLKFKAGYDKHLIEVEDIIRKKNKGVVGGHNFDNFKNVFKDKGWDVNECIINIKEHPSIDGIYEVEYRLPALNNKGEIIPETYKNIPNPKTVYNPSKISDENIIKWGKEAMQEGIKNNRVTNGREIEGYAQNGLKFKGYIDEETKEITNFFPTLK